MSREDSHKKNSIPDSWRKSQGTHSRARREEKGAVKKPKAGRRTSKESRGKHPSGFEERHIQNISDVQDLDPENEAARLCSKLGERKKQKIIEKLDEKDAKILNRGVEQ